MNELNSILLEGRLTKDAVLKELASGLKVCEMTIAYNRKFKGNDEKWNEEVSYFDVTSFGKLAEHAADSGKKGTEIRVVGRLHQSRWKGSDGKENSKVGIQAEHIEFRNLGKKGTADECGQASGVTPVEEGFNIEF